MRSDCGPTTGCHGCGGSVPKGRRVWCSNACSLSVVLNHDWQAARTAVLKRDGYACVICAATGHGEKGKEFRRIHRRSYLEVNHIVPVNGRRKSWSCQNHQSNLETLCHDCHGVVTRQQRADGLIGGRRTHLFKVLRLGGTAFVQCQRCGAADTSVHFAASVKVGRTIWVRGRMKEICHGPNISGRKPLRRRRKKR